MKSQKGVTLATVVLIVVVMVIIASTSIIVGNKLIINAKEQKREENLKAVQAAVGREITKLNSSGVISPGYYDYIGTKNPVISRTSSGAIEAGEDWYLLTPSDLVTGLGIKGIDGTYLVNYKLNVVIDVDATEDLSTELQKYN